MLAEGTLGVLRVAVDPHAGDRAPLRARVVGLAGAAAHRDHAVAAAHQPRHEVRPDVPGGPDHDNAAHPSDLSSPAGRSRHPRMAPTRRSEGRRGTSMYRKTGNRPSDGSSIGARGAGRAGAAGVGGGRGLLRGSGAVDWAQRRSALPEGLRLISGTNTMARGFL